jgi:hypothetical protein
VASVRLLSHYVRPVSNVLLRLHSFHTEEHPATLAAMYKDRMRSLVPGKFKDLMNAAKK